MNGNMQKPYSNNQVKNNKPSVPMSKDNILTGHFQGSMNGGHNKTQTYFYVMANQRIHKLMLQEKIRLLTPFTPPYMRLFCTYRVYNVPHSAVWKDYEKFFGQKGGASEEKIKEIPNLGNINIPTIKAITPEGEDENDYVYITDTALWRDHILSPYLPRTGTGKTFLEGDDTKFPKMSILAIRGRMKIANLYERNKEFDEEFEVYEDENVEDVVKALTEIKEQKYVERYMGRAKNNNNYYSDFRTELQGLEASYPPSDMSANTSLENWMANFENLIAESRSEAENANLNDNELIAKLRGSQLLTEGRVTKIAEKTIPLNYSSITQTNYNNIANEKAQATGTQGAYSYTEINIPILEEIKFKEDGIVHIVATVWAEKIYETAYDRMDLNVGALDLYRPDMLEAKKDILYRAEIDNSEVFDEGLLKTTDYYESMGFKRKYNEYFKLRNTIFGDLTTNPYYDWDDLGDSSSKYDSLLFDRITQDRLLLTNNTYQFNLMGARMTYDADRNQYIKLNYWQDYTDILINKNLAYKENVYNGPDLADIGRNGKQYVIITGQNQVDFVGNLTMLTTLPIDDSIKSNMTNWAEH